MALRLGGLVTGGELINTRRNSTHGFLNLEGSDRVLVFELTGNCDPDLAGRHIRFKSRAKLPSELTEVDLDGVAWQQVGPTVAMTASSRIRTFDGSIEDFYEKSKAGQQPPTQWRDCLKLEWHGQNGRVLVELVDPEIETLDFKPIEGISDDDVSAAARSA